MEYLDLVNGNDEVIGNDTRENINRKKLSNYRVVNIIIENTKGNVVLAKRSNTKKYFAGCYFFSVGGHVKSGETYEEAAYRELNEELGIRNVEIIEIGHFKPEKLNTSSFSKLYKLIYDGNFKIDKEEIEIMSEFSKSELRELLKTKPEKFSSDFVKIYKWILEK